MDHDKTPEKRIKWWFETDEHLTTRVHYKDSVPILVFDAGPVYFPSFGFSSDITLCSTGKKLEYPVLHTGTGPD